MTRWTLILRSLRFHARSHLGVLLGAAVASAALTGALLVGDSVRQTLLDRALARLGPVQFALTTLDRLFLDDLGQRMERPEVAGAQSATGLCSPALLLPCTVARQDGTARLNQVNLLGVDLLTWGRLAGWRSGEVSPQMVRRLGLKEEASTGLPANVIQEWEAGGVALVNQALATQLRLKPGDELVVRLRKPTALAQDAVISPREENVVALRLKTTFVLAPEQLGNFSLVANQLPAANIFLPLAALQKAAGVPRHANFLLNTGSTSPQAALERSWKLEDAQLGLAVLPPRAAAPGNEPEQVLELSTARIFLEPQAAEAALHPKQPTAKEPVPPQFTGALTNCAGILTYLANLLQAGSRSTPYSMVTAAGAPYAPADMRDNEIILNEWLAADLQAKSDDTITLSYYIADSGARLMERTNTFTVRSVVPMQGVYADRSLMPEFPGLAKAESTHDWDAGFPLVYPIRPEDEAYWKQFRGTPKAFVTLAAGQAMWGNRFGSLTAVRWTLPIDVDANSFSNALRLHLQASLEPGSAFGLRFQPVRQLALNAANQSQDFGQLFLGFSFFLVVSALLLTAMLFQFSLEQRAPEIGTLLALGFTPRQVRRLFLLEGLALSLLGGLIGALGGLAYAKAMLWALVTHWRSAVGTSVLQFHASPTTLLIGIFAGTVVAALAIWLTLRKQARQPAAALLAGAGSGSPPVSPGRGLAHAVSRPALVCGVISLVAALALLAWAATRDASNPGAFFGAGSLLLVSGLSFVALQLGFLSRSSRGDQLTLAGLGFRGTARRRSRSLVTVALLACGTFVVTSVGVFRLNSNEGASRRESGTGGFALIGESALPVLQDLNTRSGREALGLSEAETAGMNVVPFRVRQGEDASCLNLNRAQTPRLLGVRPELLAGRFTFAKVAPAFRLQDGWAVLKSGVRNRNIETDEIPAIGDANSIQWALGKAVGDTVNYTDEHGRSFKLRLVGALANSILQGSLVIDEEAFIRKFPTESGYRFFLIDALPGMKNGAPDAPTGLSAALSRALQDFGLELTPAARRLNAFNAVQNTYLGTFQILGGLGLLLGSAGLGVVVLRNVLERRGELASLMAVGFQRVLLRRLLLIEHGALLFLGLSLGLGSALVAVLPAMLTPGSQFPVLSLSLTLAGVLLNGVLWTWLATRYATSGQLLAALRNE